MTGHGDGAGLGASKTSTGRFDPLKEEKRWDLALCQIMRAG